MGSEKALLSYRGKTLLERAVHTLRQLRAPVRLVVNRNQKLSLPGCAVLVDEVDDAGPMGGLLTALRFSSSEINYLLACDLPLVPAQLFRILEKLAPRWDAVVPVDHSGRPHPLCAVYRPTCLPEVERCISTGDLRMDGLAASPSLRTRIVTPAEHRLADNRFLNVNRPGDLDRGAS